MSEQHLEIQDIILSKSPSNKAIAIATGVITLIITIFLVSFVLKATQERDYLQELRGIPTPALKKLMPLCEDTNTQTLAAYKCRCIIQELEARTLTERELPTTTPETPKPVVKSRKKARR